MVGAEASQSKSSVRILLSTPMNRKFQRRITVADMNDTGLGYVAAAFVGGVLVLSKTNKPSSIEKRSEGKADYLSSAEVRSV